MASARREEQLVGGINVPVGILNAREHARLRREGMPRDVPRGLADVIAPSKLLASEPVNGIDLVPVGPGLLPRVFDNLQDLVWHGLRSEPDVDRLVQPLR